MRLGLESSPSRATQASISHDSHPESDLQSAFIPIEVDSDSSDDAKPPATSQQSALTPSENKPSLLNFSASTSTISTDTTQHLPMTLGQHVNANDSIDDDEFLSISDTQLEDSMKPIRNFFLNVKDQSMSKQQSRGIFCNSVNTRSLLVSDELHEVISAARASICGQKFDRCELEFTKDCVELTIWKDSSAQWQGQIEYAHMERFCFSRTQGPPYLLLLELNCSLNRSDFASFYDLIFAKSCERDEAKGQPISKMYGVVFYFDEEMDYTRCQSMSDNNPKLAHLICDHISESEVRKYLRLDAVGRLRQRIDSTSIKVASGVGLGMASIVGTHARNALDSVASFFRPTSRPLVLKKNGKFPIIRESRNPAGVRTLNFTSEHNGLPATNSSKGKSPMLIGAAGRICKQNLKSNAVDGTKTAILVQNTQDEADVRHASLNFILSQQNVIDNGEVESGKRVAGSRRVDEQYKRRKLESRRDEVLLTYPYDGSDTAGRISVTLGDVDRLVPGEFLNDNIIDFYLRFLWRHLAPRQQQQIYFFTSHFFTQLNGANGTYESTRVDPNEQFARVARWTQKETNLFDKRFLFIPINDSFHWSIAVFCNPGSAIIKKHRRVIQRHVMITARNLDERDVVDLVDDKGYVGGNEVTSGPARNNDDKVEDVEEFRVCQNDRFANPPCLLFLDSLRCHPKKKFTIMLRNYLEREWKARYASNCGSALEVDDAFYKKESFVTLFDSDRIDILEPNIPLQSNSSDCGVYLLMYAASIVHNFPAGVTREDLKNNLTPTLTSSMFRNEHVREFRDYLQQLLFCLQFLEKKGISEDRVKDEGLEFFTID